MKGVDFGSYIDSPASIDSIDSQKRSNNVTISLNVLYAKKEKKKILLMFQKITLIMKN